MSVTDSHEETELRRNLYSALFRVGGDGDSLSVANRFLVAVILASVLVAILESEAQLSGPYATWFLAGEAVFGTIFVIEYLLRLWLCVEDPRYSSPVLGRLRYALTPAALFDLVAVMPLFLTLLGSEAFILRLLRLMRILRLAKLGRYSLAARAIGKAINSRRHELVVSLAAGVLLMLVAATCLYIAEGTSQPEAFGSIPRAMWWAIATLTTVGYGDTYPVTGMGKVFAGITAIIGIGLVAMPAGILAAAFSDVLAKKRTPE